MHSSKAEFLDAMNFAVSKNIKPVIAKTMPITEAAKAHKSLEDSEIFGKMVLESTW